MIDGPIELGADDPHSDTVKLLRDLVEMKKKRGEMDPAEYHNKCLGMIMDAMDKARKSPPPSVTPKGPPEKGFDEALESVMESMRQNSVKLIGRDRSIRLKTVRRIITDAHIIGRSHKEALVWALDALNGLSEEIKDGYGGVHSAIKGARSALGIVPQGRGAKREA